MEQDVCISEDPPDNSVTFNVLLVDDDVPGVGGLTSALTVFLEFVTFAFMTPASKSVLL